MTTVGILVCDEFSEEISAKYPGAYEDLFISSLKDADPTLIFETFGVFKNEFPKDYSVCEGWLVTGARAGAYEKLSWIGALESFVRDAYAQDVPVVGVCFGHQLIAQALGGRVEKSSKGWGLGCQAYQMQASLEGLNKDLLSLYCMHQDQVVDLPPDALVVGTNAHCEFAILKYRGSALSFQPHPEFSKDFMGDLTRSAAGKSFPVDLADEVLRDLSATQPDNDVVMKVIADFLSGKA